MSVLVYTKGDTHEVRGVKCKMSMVEPQSLNAHLSAGWVLDPVELAEDSEKSQPKNADNKQIRAQAKDKGIDGWDKKRVNTLKEELGHV